jgi:NAD(P)-dependent dehydrogenase (short-subunit alcohol dehydrogenase family)
MADPVIPTNLCFDPRRTAVASDELAGRVIAVTGASSGLGRAVSLEAARRGAEVILIGRHVRRLESVFEEIARSTRHDGSPVAPATIAPLNLETALARDYDAIAEAVEQRWGRLDGLLHNAAQLGMLSPIDQYDVPTWARVLHVNLTAAFALTQVLLPAMRRSADASIVFASSSVGRKGRALWGAYAVSKFGIEGLSEVLSSELEGTSVRCNSLNPGAARTLMRRQAYPAADASAWPLPETLTAPYVALLGPASRGITGRRFDAQ